MFACVFFYGEGETLSRKGIHDRRHGRGGLRV